MSEAERTKVKDWLIIIATAINILIGASVIFGGMEWITRVNSTLAVTTSTLQQIVTQVGEITKWETSHEVQHAKHP